MEKEILSRNVCELLAQQLVTEQAELVKQEAVVENCIKTLKAKKKLLIEFCLEGEYFTLDDSRVLAFAADFYDTGETFWVRVLFAKTPASFYNDKVNLTRREKQLLNQYKKAFKRCRWGFNEEAGKEIRELARKIHQLKNGLILTNSRSWSFSIEDFSSPDFFRNSGLYLDNMSRYGDSILIENLKCK